MADNTNDLFKKLSTSVITSAITKIKEAYSNVKELDSLLTDLKNTASMTDSQLEDFFYSANSLAKQLGTTTNEILKQAGAWTQLGYSIEDTKSLIESASVLDAISPDIDLSEAFSGLADILKAFQIDAEDSLDGIISKISIIGETMGISNGDILNILTESGAAMAEAGSTLDQTIALGAAAAELTGNAAEAGEALKNISLQIQGYNEGTDTYTDNLNSLSETITNLTQTAVSPDGISLFTDDAEQSCKSTYQLISDISSVWNELSENNRTQLLTALTDGGQTQELSAMISNFDTARTSLDAMAGSAGTAQAKMSAAMDSISYKANNLKETGTGIAQNLFADDDMKAVIDGLTAVGNVIESITGKLGLFGTLAAGAGLFAGLNNVGRDKMFSLNNCFEYADYNMCSLGY